MPKRATRGCLLRLGLWCAMIVLRMGNDNAAAPGYQAKDKTRKKRVAGGRVCSVLCCMQQARGQAV